jgi:hypothetical protein
VLPVSALGFLVVCGAVGLLGLLWLVALLATLVHYAFPF